MAERGWIKDQAEIEAAEESQAGYLTQEDIDWATARATALYRHPLDTLNG